jgi:hypothetical protein
MDRLTGDDIGRTMIHNRVLDMRGYLRSDGLWEVQAHLKDTRTSAFRPAARSDAIPSGAPIHDMQLAVVFDDDLVVRDIASGMNAHPYAACAGGGTALRNLIGVRMASGWGKEVRRLLPACQSCTHLREMLLPLASVAFQTQADMRVALYNGGDAKSKENKADSCIAFSKDGDVLKALWPD